jgi:hypothetical protein
MKLAIMQPYFFPYLGYFQLINAVDKFVIYDDVNYIKQGWINRNNILLNNSSYQFTIPIEDASSFKTINRTKINRRLYSIWLSKFLKTLDLGYKKAPFYQNVLPVIEKILYGNYEYINQLNAEAIIEVCNHLKIDSMIQVTSMIYQNSDLKGSDRVIDICKTEKAKVYINASGGEQLYSKEIFKQDGIDLFFLNTQSIYYKQFKNVFIPNLSIIDVLMFNDVKSVKEFLTNYKLK